MIGHRTRRIHIRSNRLLNIDLVLLLLRTFLIGLTFVVFKTLETELLAGGLKSLIPIDRVDPAAGMAVSSVGLRGWFLSLI